MNERAQQLFEHQLQDMYDAELRLVDALDEMAKDARDGSLKNGFREHLRVTKEQARRLERIFKGLGRKPKRTSCKGIQGLIEEYKTFVREERPEDDVRDLFAASAALKVEHYEIAAYQSLSELATMLGHGEAATLLGETLTEETATAGRLTAASAKLGSELTGANTGGVLRQVGDTVRQGALAAVGAADVVRERAVGAAGSFADTAGDMADEAEARGRKVLDRSDDGRSSASGSGSRPSRTKSTGSRSKSSSKSSKSSGRGTSSRSTSSRSKSSGSRSKSAGARSKASGSRSTSRSKSSGSTSKKASGRATSSRSKSSGSRAKASGSRSTGRSTSKSKSKSSSRSGR